MSKYLKNKIAQYYDYTVPFYQYFWHGSSHGLHYGYWTSDTHTLHEAIANENHILSERARITANDHVLDAGCGVGGSALWLAQRVGCTVEGITLSSRQARKAKQLAHEARVESGVSFFTGDFFKTGFPSEHFSVVWAIESLCYGHNRLDELAKELFRVSKPGGRLIIADGFLGKEREELSGLELRAVEIFERGFVLPKLVSSDIFIAAFRRAGFVNIQYEDATPHVLPTARRMWWMCMLTYPIAKLLEMLGITAPLLTSNNRTGIVQRKLSEGRTLVYGIVYAERPGNQNG